MEIILRIRVKLEIVAVVAIVIVEVAVIIVVKNKRAKMINKTERIPAIFLIILTRNLKVIWKSTFSRKKN